MKNILIISNVILMSLGQICFKKAAVYFSTLSEQHLILRFLLNPWYYVAGILYVTATFLYVKILTDGDLSMTYIILTAATILITTILSYLFFKETLSVINIVGIVVIILGILLITKK